MSLKTERRQEILLAALRLVASEGFDSVTMDAIAAATRASKATLYRHWQDKADLITDAVTQGIPSGSDVADTGSLRTDLYEFVHQSIAHFGDISTLAISLGNAAARHSELGESLRASIIGAEDAGFTHLLDRAVARGEIQPDHPGLAYAPLLMFAIVELAPTLGVGDLTEDHLRDYIDHVVLPVLAPTT